MSESLPESRTVMRNEVRRYLITIGSPEAPGERLLSRVASDVDRITDLFCSPPHSYKRVLHDVIPLGSPARLIQDSILDWFTSAQRLSSDWVILYFAGHGGDAGLIGNYYLFTADTNQLQLPRTAINVSRFVQDLFEGTSARPQNVLLILDACFAGRGAAQAIKQNVAVREMGAFRGGAGLWVVATADSFSQAEDGAYVDALLAVLQDPAWAPAGGAEYLNPVDVLVFGANEWLLRHDHTQQAEWDVLGGARRPAFLQNPRYTKKLDGFVLLDETHWNPKARGVEGITSAGWFFTGRRRALQTLVSWLNAPESDLRARVVTGRPGSGKSAVLARLITTANPRKRAEMVSRGLLDFSDGTVPAENAISAYVHARGLSAVSIAASISKQLSISGRSIEDLMLYLRQEGRTIRLVIDALDEAEDPLDLEFRFLRQLCECASVRLLIGTRKHHDSVPLAAFSEIVDLDKPLYFDRADIVEYVNAFLINGNQLSPYSAPSYHENARKIAEFVADRARFSFLYARLVARKIAGQKLIDTNRIDWTSDVPAPTDLNQAFELDLERFSTIQRQKVIDLLIPLAWARGKGLPQKAIWAAIASSISTRSYSNSDIRELKQIAGYYLIQDVQHDEVVYRLFHESFAEYLRSLSRDEAIDKHFTAVLESLAVPATDRKTDWPKLVEEYALHYLPSHAAAAGELDRLLQDVEFLLHFYPESLLPHLASARSSIGRAIARSYRMVSHHLRDDDRATKVPYLLLSATQNRADVLVSQLQSLISSLEPKWTVTWAAWAPTIASEVVIEAKEPIKSFAYLDDEKNPSFIVGLEHAVYVYDALTSREITCSPTLDIKLKKLAWLRGAGRTWIVVAGEEEERRDGKSHAALITLEYPSCGIYAKKEDAHAYGWGVLRSFSVVSKKGALQVATAGGDRALRVWSVPDLRLVSERFPADFAAISGLLGIELENLPLLICGGDSVNPEGERSVKGTPIFTVALPSLKRITTFYEKSGGWVRHMIPITLENQELVLANYEYEGLRVLDVLRGVTVAATPARLDVFGSLQQTANSVLVFGVHYDKLEVVELSCEVKAEQMTIRFKPMHAGVEVKGQSWHGPLKIGGRSTIVSAGGKQLRMWDTEDLVASNVPERTENLVTATLVEENDELRVVTADAIGSIIVRSGQTGKVSWSFQPQYGDYVRVTCLAAASLNSKPVVVLLTVGGQIIVYDASSGDSVRSFKVGERLDAITCHSSENASLCFAATNLAQEGRKNDYAVTTWDLGSGVEKLWNSDDAWRSGGDRLVLTGYEDKSLTCLAVGERDGLPVLYASGPYSFVKAWRLDQGRATRIGEYWTEPARGNQWIHALGIGTLGTERVIAAGNEEGILVVWNATTRQEIIEVHDGHRGGITSLAFLENGRGLVTCGSDGILKVWSPQVTHVGSIDIEHPGIALQMLDDETVLIVTQRGLAALKLYFN